LILLNQQEKVNIVKGGCYKTVPFYLFQSNYQSKGFELVEDVDIRQKVNNLEKENIELKTENKQLKTQNNKLKTENKQLIEKSKNLSRFITKKKENNKSLKDMTMVELKKIAKEKNISSYKLKKKQLVKKIKEMGGI